MTFTEYFALARGNQIRLAAMLAEPQANVSRWAAGTHPLPADKAAAIERATGGAVARQDLFPDTWASIWPELAFKVELGAAIAQTRLVFEGEPVAVDVLAYLNALLDTHAFFAGAPVPAQTGIEPGAENASIAEEGLAVAGAAPVMGPDPFRSAARQAVMWQARADLAQAVDAPARPTAAQQAEINRHQAAIDQAAARMAAESARKLADAERSVAARAGTILSKLVVEVDTTQLDAALAKAKDLGMLLASINPREVAST